MDYKLWWEKAISFEVYLENFEHELEHGSKKPFADKLPINWQRTSRILKTLTISDEILEKICNLNSKIKWLVISEHWCGDSAQIIPVMKKLSEASEGKIELKFLYRDDYPEFIDAHLTNKGRSIPKIIQLDEKFIVTGMYGPRPQFAMDLVKRLKSNPETADNYSEELHKWYAQDKQKSILEDLITILVLNY